MEKHSSNPQLSLPLVGADFWRAAISEFDSQFRNWLTGRISDETMREASAKFDYAVVQTRLREPDAAPVDPSNGQTLAEEGHAASIRWCRLDRALNSLRYDDEFGREYRGDSLDVIRQRAYFDEIERTTFKDAQYTRVLTLGY